MAARALATDLVSAGTLGFVGDIICQHIEQRGSAEEVSVDKRRLLSLTTFNTLYVGGFLHFLYRGYPLGIDAVATRLLPTSQARRVMNRDSLAHAMACGWADNLHNAVLYIPTFFVGVGVLQGDGVAASFANLRANWWETYASCTAFWVVRRKSSKRGRSHHAVPR
jgi:hypothetical protein